MGQTEDGDGSPKSSRVAALIAIAIGCYFLIGAYFSWRDAKWPVFMPPQLDILGLLFELFGRPTGAYVGAGFLFVLGLLFGLAPLLVWRTAQRKAQRRLPKRRGG